MARLSANLGDFKPMEVLPKDTYKASLTEIKSTDPKNPNLPLTSKAGNQMFENTWTVIEGPEANRKINFDTVVYAGRDKNGQPISPFRLADLIEALDAPWVCGACGAGPRPAKFYRGRGPDVDGKKKGAIYCPDCENAAQIDVDTNDLLGKTCLIAVDIEPIPGKDREKNVIKAYSVIP